MNVDSRNETPTPMRQRLRAFAAAAILEAAEAVFSEQGLQAGMDAVAARAGVAVGTLYKHFQDREGLLQALLDARLRELLASMDAAVAATAAAPFELQLEALLGAVVAHTERHAAFRRVALQAEMPASHPSRIAVRAGLVERLNGVLARGRREGRLQPDAEGLQALLLLGLLHSVLVLSVALHESAAGGRGWTADDVARLVTQQFLHGAAAA